MSDDEMRDIGPYRDVHQAMKQFDNWSKGIPQHGSMFGLSERMMIREALLMAGVEPSDFEMDYLADLKPDPLLATIVHGFILKAFLSGIQHGRTETRE